MDEIKFFFSLATLIGVGGLMFYFVSIFFKPIKSKSEVLDFLNSYEQEREENRKQTEKLSSEDIAKKLSSGKWIVILLFAAQILVSCSSSRLIISVISEPPAFPKISVEFDAQKKIFWMSERDGIEFQIFKDELKIYREELKKDVRELKKAVEK